MKGVPLPPADERHLDGPTKPPLDSGLEFGLEEDKKPELPFGMDVPMLDESLGIVEGGIGLDLPLSNGDIVGGQGMDTARDPTPVVVPSTAAVTEGAQAGSMEMTSTDAPAPIPALIRTTSEDQVEIKVEHPEPPTATDSHTASSAPPESSEHPIISPQIHQRPLSAPPTSDADKVDMTIFDSLDPDALEALVLAATSDSPPLTSVAPPPPPPPIRRASDTLEHVDVDLGPLKSVSRNHAKISYFADLGHFCLEILGRNGAWVDDRYFVRGSTVPLNQG
jgi:hypothetical protein